MTKKCLLGYETPVIIASSPCWHCENLDNLAPIDREGYCYLFSNGEQVVLWNDMKGNEPEEIVKLFENTRSATEEERKQYARIKMERIFKGDTVVIKRGRKMVGETKVVAKGYTYTVEGTYGHVTTNYLVFTDGTKCNVNHCDVVGIEYEPYISDGKEYFFRWFVEDNELNYLFNIGGRQ